MLGSLIRQTKKIVGKETKEALYIHESALRHTPEALQDYVSGLWIAAGEPEFTLVKIHHDGAVSFLFYPDFDDDPHPALESSVSISPKTLVPKPRVEGQNPPILHRKETFVHSSHPRYKEWARLTREEEEAGLLDPSVIYKLGRRDQWEAFVASKKNPKRKCSPSDFEGMGRTFRPGIGMTKQPGESWEEVATRAVEVGEGPLVARYVYNFIEPDGTFLDFGAGAQALQTRALRNHGYDIVGYEWPRDDAAYEASLADGSLQEDALDYQYDYVLASNVLNVQPTWPCFYETMELIVRAMKNDAVFICNLASSPRQIWSGGQKGNNELELELLKIFTSVEVFRKVLKKAKGGFAEDPIWVCRL